MTTFINVKGVKGDRGEPGELGKTGDIGDPGYTPNRPPDKPNGSTGRTGLSGPAGEIGELGDQGDKGLNGYCTYPSNIRRDKIEILSTPSEDYKKTATYSLKSIISESHHFPSGLITLDGGDKIKIEQGMITSWLTLDNLNNEVELIA